ncbi:spore germination protein [Oceanobacillus senegalensis]|uniref:spore germination protein n=1 Tax=Oceanobacillus senegalensis TaxID=1936063 RepID=UPI000A30D798|nr:spore germination protein [Oceanobacillus senegalensis]
MRKWLKKKKEPMEVENIPSDLATPLHKDIKQTLDHVKALLGDSSDLVVREFKIGSTQPVKAALLYVDGMASKMFVQNFITETLMIDLRLVDLPDEDSAGSSEKESSNPQDGLQKKKKSLIKPKTKPQEKDLFKVMKEQTLANSEVEECKDYKGLFSFILAGDSVILLDGYETAFAIGSKGYESRAVEESSSTTVIRGPREGFTETLRINTSLIRRRIKDPNLWIENKVIGKKTHTDVSICYINGIVNEKIVKEVKKRINAIDTDAILESGYIEEYIQDSPYSPFPTVYNTERPDTICAGLLEGKVAIIVDGTPFVLLVPTLIIDFFQSSEDYYQRVDIGTMLRLLRYLGFFLALLTPSMYIALTTFHQEMIPTQLLISLAAQREGVPFPAFVEALIMEFVFDILREAGTRMPRAIGSAISIVGALVVGQAAVQAGFVSAAMVIVVSLTAISSFLIPSPDLSSSIRILRYPFMTLAASFGLLGIIIGVIFMVLHLASLRSFGIPYLSPMGPMIIQDQKDALIRMPLWRISTRPRLMNQKNIVRENTDKPSPNRK